MNYYAHATLNENLKCTKKDAKQLSKLLETDEYGCGLDAFYIEREKAVILYAESHFIPEELNSKILNHIAKMIKAQKLEYIEFGIAYTADKPIAGSHGGSSCIITNDGQVVYRTPANTYNWETKTGVSRIAHT